MSHQCHKTEHFPALDMDDVRNVLAALGPMPRETLSAMVDYGMNDVEISRYFRISTGTVAALRQHFDNRVPQKRDCP